MTFAFTGDNLTHSPIVNAARTPTGYDFTPMFAEIAPIIRWADVAVCHLETPVAPPGEELSTYPRYGVPPDIATSLAAVGYDRCSTASNHTMDRGAAGIDATVGALATAGVAQSGMARTPEESVPQLFTVNGITFAHLSFTFGFNGASLPPGEPWRSNLLSAGAVIAQARDARARGAQVVIASLHWGNEGSAVITAEQRAIAEQVTASGSVDLIVGHHVHVLQPIEQVNGRWVVYGMGNILSNLPTPTGRAWPASTQDGMIVTLSFSRQPDGSIAVSRPQVIPTWVDKNARLADPSGPAGPGRSGAPAGHPSGAGRLPGAHVVGGRRLPRRRSAADGGAAQSRRDGRYGPGRDAAGDDLEPVVAVRPVGAAPTGDRRGRRRAAAGRPAAARGVDRRRNRRRRPARRAARRALRADRRPRRHGEGRRSGSTTRSSAAGRSTTSRNGCCPARRSPSHRRILLADVATPWGAWPCASTHLDYQFDQSATPPGAAGRGARRRGRPARRSERDLPVVVGGDFNAVPDSDEIRMVTGRAGAAPCRRAAERLLGTRRRGSRAHVAAGQPVPGRHGLAAAASRLRVRLLAAPQADRQPGRRLAGRHDPVEGTVPSDHAAVVVELTTPSLTSHCSVGLRAGRRHPPQAVGSVTRRMATLRFSFGTMGSGKSTMALQIHHNLASRSSTACC